MFDEIDEMMEKFSFIQKNQHGKYNLTIFDYDTYSDAYVAGLDTLNKRFTGTDARNFAEWFKKSHDMTKKRNIKINMKFSLKQRDIILQLSEYLRTNFSTVVKLSLRHSPAFDIVYDAPDLSFPATIKLPKKMFYQFTYVAEYFNISLPQFIRLSVENFGFYPYDLGGYSKDKKRITIYIDEYSKNIRETK